MNSRRTAKKVIAHEVRLTRQDLLEVCRTFTGSDPTAIGMTNLRVTLPDDHYTDDIVDMQSDGEIVVRFTEEVSCKP